MPEPENLVGGRIPPVDWEAKTTGRAEFAGDKNLPGTLYGAVTRSAHPHALILEIDPAPALAMDGVHAVVTCEDLGHDPRYIHAGEPYRDRRPLARDRVRFIGEEIAAVAAESPALARAAAAAVRVRYRRLPAPLTLRQALGPAAPVLHDRVDGPNIGAVLKGAWGEEPAVDAELYSLRATYGYPRTAHASMEPHTTLARWDDAHDRLELWTSTQSPYFVRRDVAHVLGLDEQQVVCRDVAVGGSFGVKSKVGEQEVLAALLSRKTKRPVLIALDRSEEFAATKTRHPFRTDLRTRYDSEGRIHHLDATIEVENGAYNNYGPTVIKSAAYSIGSTYRCRGVRFDSRLVDTAVLPGGPFRGYGQTQVAFAVESQVDEIAAHLGVDPIDLRIRNAVRPFDRLVNGAQLGSAQLVRCLEVVREAIGWDDKRRNASGGHGIGVAVAVHASGTNAFPGANESEAGVDLFEDGHVRVRFASGDAGTGQRTILAQIAAQTLGVDLRDVDVVLMDTELAPTDQGAWSSRGTHYSGHAVDAAATRLKDKIVVLARAKLGEGPVSLRDGWAHSDTGGSIPLGDLVAADPDAVGRLSCEAGYIERRSQRPAEPGAPYNKSASYSFAAHAVELTVDRSTGEVRLLDYVAVHDVGQAINPTQVEGQIVGGVVMGLGAAFGEELIIEGGRVVNPTYLHYPLRRSADVPHVRTIVLEGSDEAGPFGAKSVGEIPLHPPGPAVANAIHHAVGVRLRELPLTPDKIVDALHAERPRPFRPAWRRPSRWWISLMRAAYPRGVHKALDRWGTRLAARPTAQVVPEVSRPQRVEDASRLGVDGGALVAGGADLLPMVRRGYSTPHRLVLLSGISELLEVQPTEEGGLRLGGGVTLAQAGEALSGRHPLVTEAIETIATPQLRARSTVAGNLLQQKRCWFYRNDFLCYKRGGATCPCYAITGDHRFHHAVLGAHRCQAVTPSDLATVFTALDAMVTTSGPAGRRDFPFDDLYTGPGETRLQDGEVLCAVTLPAPGRTRGAFRKLRLWSGDFAIVSVALAATVDVDGRWEHGRIVLGGVGPTPWTAHRTARAMLGEPARADRVMRLLRQELAAQAHPLRDNGWKVHAVLGLAEQALREMTDPRRG